MRVSIMIAGASGLNWTRWKRLVRAAEELGFDGIYRSDHFLDHWSDRPSDALETFISLAWAADNSEHIELGPLVSPISFRDPRILAWQATAINTLAKGRLRVGLGVGWQPNEHEAFGFELGSVQERSARFAEGVQVVKALTRSDAPVSLSLERYPLRGARLLPRWPDVNSPAIVIGGNGLRRTIPLAAKYADEWNCMMMANHDFIRRNKKLDELLDAEGRDPRSVRRSLMCRSRIARDQAALDAHPDVNSFDELRGNGAVVGTPNEVVQILSEKSEAGVESIMLQWMEQDDIAGLELIATKVLPQLRG